MKRFVAIAVLGLAGCTSNSKYMVPAAAPSGPVPGKAVVLFASDVEESVGASTVLTVYDENRRFLGELFEHSMFEVVLPAGKHGFGAVDLVRGTRFRPPNAGICSVTFTAELEADKVYIVWVRWEHFDMAVGGIRWIFVRPDSKLMAPAQALRMWRSVDEGDQSSPVAKPFFRPDLAAGQEHLDPYGARLCVPKTEPGPKGPDLPPSFGFDALPK